MVGGGGGKLVGSGLMFASNNPSPEKNPTNNNEKHLYLHRYSSKGIGYIQVMLELCFIKYYQNIICIFRVKVT